jgi:hypothetical protein
MQVVCYEGQPPDGWDERLYAARAEAGLCQSTYWARVIHRLDRATPLFLEVHHDGEVAASLMLFRKEPWDRRAMRRKRGLGEFLSGVWRGWLEWLDGPVLHAGEEVKIERALAALLVWVDEYAGKGRLSRISSAFAHTSRWAAQDGVAALFAGRGYTTSRWATYLVDLEPEEDRLWYNLDKAARKSVKKARSLGVQVRPISSLEALQASFYAPYCAIEAAAGRGVPPLSAFEVSWGEDREGYYRYYVAESAAGEILATLGMYIFNGVAVEIASSLSPQAFEQKIPAQDLLHWEMFLEARRASCHTFDLAGINPDPADPREAGIRRFKKKWGGRYVEYNRFGKAMGPGRAWQAAMSLAGRLRQIAGRPPERRD